MVYMFVLFVYKEDLVSVYMSVVFLYREELLSVYMSVLFVYREDLVYGVHCTCLYSLCTGRT